MRLAPFIRKHKKEITEEWVEYARENIHVTEKMDLTEVRDHIMQMLERIADDMETPQSESQQKAKSRGHKAPALKEGLIAQKHGEQRLEKGFDIVELSSEFRALRASVLQLWEEKMTTDIGEEKFKDMMRFNEAIDEAWMHSIEKFHTKMDESKNWFLGILGHDLRNPLAAITGVQQLLQLSPNLSDKEKAILHRTDTSAKRMKELIDNLLELTNLRLGSGMSIERSTTDLAKLSEQIVQEFQVSYPQATFELTTPGPLEGKWDRLRLEQVLNNLMANALRHGEPGGPVKVAVSAEGNTAFLSVNNQGAPIPEDVQDMIFTGMFTQSNHENHENARENSYGLGLYIVKEIVAGHNGDIDLESTEERGTTFTISLPRH